MADGIEGGRKIQLGKEGTAGTAVPATAIYRGKGLPEDRRVVTFIEEDIGLVSGADRTGVAQLLAGFSFEPTPATFEQTPILLSAGIDDAVTGVTDVGGSGKIYPYPMPITAPTTNTPKTYTLEGGDNNQAEEVEYGFVESFKLTGKPMDFLLASAEWVGRQVTPTTFTGALTLPTVEAIPFSLGKLYIDDVSGTIGSTLTSATFMGMELAVKTGWQVMVSGDGQLYFTKIKHTREAMEVVLNITFEHNATASAEKAAWRAQTARQLRLEWLGTALATAGALYTYKTARIDLAGKWEKFEKLGSQNGNDVINGVFRARYNAVADLFAEFLWVNELAALA